MNPTYKNYTDFFEQVAIDHADIAHVDQDNCSFYTTDIDELITGIRSTMNKNQHILVLVNYNGHLEGLYNKIRIDFFVVRYCPPVDFKAQREAKDNAELIAVDILAYIRDKSIDYDNEENIKLWGGSFDEASGVSIIQTSITAGTERFYGVQVSFDLRVPFCLNMRPNKFPSWP